MESGLTAEGGGSLVWEASVVSPLSIRVKKGWTPLWGSLHLLLHPMNIPHKQFDSIKFGCESFPFFLEARSLSWLLIRSLSLLAFLPFSLSLLLSLSFSLDSDSWTVIPVVICFSSLKTLCLIDEIINSFFSIGHQSWYWSILTI